jgi:hypothetical protein
MSEIPFIDQLGTAIDAAITKPPVARRRRRVSRGGLLVAAAALALAVAAIAVARVLSSSDDLATHSIGCYAQADLGSDVAVINNDGPPVAACATALSQMGRSVPPLVACANGATVAVIPGAGPSACTRLKLEPLPQSFAASQAKVARLADAVLALEARYDCVAPGDLARGVRALLDQQGWVGWKTQVQTPLAGPCGTVSLLDGSGRRSILGSLDTSRHVVIVSESAARSTMTLLYGARGLAPAIETESGSRCFTVAALTALVQVRARAVGRSATVQLGPPLDSTVTLADARGARYRSGCAIVTDVHPAADGRRLVAIIPRRATP